MKLSSLLIMVFMITFQSCRGVDIDTPVPGSGRFELYLEKLNGKSIGILGNHTSLVGTTHLVDTLLSQGVSIVKIFSPEHGFRGEGDAGQKINNNIDSSTGIPIISLYGSHRKPTVEDFAGIDLLLFDLQDVGTRFYTYISTLQLAMERCAEMGIKIIILDRPNPNGFYVDGPVLDTSFTSFVGMQPIPVVHGMTMGEYATMINSERWLEDGVSCEIEVIPCKNYSHSTLYQLPVGPSPNLPNMTSVYLYPSLCFFEGTVISVGRGTPTPFQIFGHPSLSSYPYIFTPMSGPGSLNPPLMDYLCYGSNLTDALEIRIVPTAMINLSWLIESYQAFPDKDKFFNNYFNTLAGGKSLRLQIESGMSAEEIRATWSDDLIAFNKLREKYLLYEE